MVVREHRNKTKVFNHIKEKENDILDTSQWTEFITDVSNDDILVTDEDFLKVGFLH